MNTVFDGLKAAPLIPLTVIAALGLWGAVRLFLTIYRYINATSLQRQRMRHGWKVRRQWKAVAMNVGLAYVDETTKGRTDLNGKALKPKHHYPRIWVHPEPYGLRVEAATIPRVGINEYDKAAQWLADAWGCTSVEVKQTHPKVIELRALVGNPLDEHHPFTWPTAEEWRLPIGRNPWGRDISIPLRDLSGIKVAGMPGFGKTMLQLGWLASLARRPDVQFGLFDGKTSDPRYGDWGEVANRAMFIVGDNPETANQRLTELVRLLKDRPSALVEERGTHKFWRHGPSESIPLVVVVMDECHNYIDSSGLRGRDKELIESNQRLMRTVAKEGRGLGVLPIVATQKQTTDAIPSAVRDNLGVGICFAVFTLDGAVAALGDAIRKDDANHPTELNDPDRFIGVCVVTGVPGLAGRYDRIRVGDVDEPGMLQLVNDAAHLRRDVIPAAAPTVRDASADSAGTAVPLQKDTTNRQTNTRKKKAS